MKFITKLKYWLILGTCKVVGALPFWLLYYVFLDVIYFVLYRVVHYRVSVVRQNLSSSFPEKSAAELKKIEKKFYYHLAELFVDAIDFAGISEKQMRKRIIFENAVDQEQKTKGTNWIAALAHYGSWEYFGAWQLHTESQVLGVYKALHDKAFDMYYNHVRSRFGLEPVERKNVLRYMVASARNPDMNVVLGLIADQYVKGNEQSVSHMFLNHQTLFFVGIEKISKRFKLPVYYMDVKKTGRARYVVRLDMIYDGNEEVPEGEVTRRYAKALEGTIRRDPPYWMWSHKRWKGEHTQLHPGEAGTDPAPESAKP